MKKNKLLIVLFFMVFVAACKTKPDEIKPPKTILNQEQMIAVLVDIHLAESYGYMERVTHIEKTELLNKEYAIILKTHNIKLEQLTQSYDWYINHPTILEVMYDSIIEQIKLQEQFAPEEKKELKEEFKDKEQKEKASVPTLPTNKNPVEHNN